jgi:2,4-dienoyl-CoA reductase-like NADH-dependent reductase (Old Yellow Enzyme family)
MKNVFEPWSLGTLRIKNRIIRSATHEGMAHPDGMPTDGLEKIYQRLAAGGAGAIITGYVGVKRNGRTFPNMRMFDSDAYVDIYKGINDRLKGLGTPVIVQLAHGGSRSNGKLTGEDVIGPGYRRKNDYGDVCREASEADILAIIDAFAAAVVRAQKAGFDGVELHAAHGYLLSEFISPKLNQRKDKWGGTIENRLRIVTEVLRRARQAVGTYPILVKISAHDEFKNGLAAQEAAAIARILQDSACDAIEVSCGYGDFQYTVRMPKLPVDAILGLMPGYREKSAFQKRLLRLAAPVLGKNPSPLHNYNVAAAELIKRNVTIPVIVVGGIRKIQDITQIIGTKDIDCVSLSRPFIIEPDIVEKFRQGKQDHSRCIDCGYCLIGVTGAPLRCYYGKVPARG